MVRASAHGDVRIMVPMVASVHEMREVRRLVAQAAEQVKARGHAFEEHIPLGMMIEVPAAAVMADVFAREAEFFSIGTNDLVQYTLAVDRGNVNLAARFTPLHPAVLRLIQRTVEVGGAAGLDVSVCGEMASQPLMALTLIGLGLRQLSVAPRSVPLLKRVVRGVSAEAAGQAARAAAVASTAAEAEAVMRRFVAAALGEELAGVDGLLDPGDQGSFHSSLPR